MHPLTTQRCSAAACALLLTVGPTACDSTSDPAPTGGKHLIGIDLPRSDSNFWNAYGRYVTTEVDRNGLDTLPISNSEGDQRKLMYNLLTMVSYGADAVVIAPQDSSAITELLQSLDTTHHKKVPVISVDTRPERGNVYMVVRADNRSYGKQACEFLGKELGGKGKVAELQGDNTSINARDRSEGFAQCMKGEYPDIQVFELPTFWDEASAAYQLEKLLTKHPDLNGIYMQAGGVFLKPTLTLLKDKGLLKPAGARGHLTIVSNDGIPEELDAIRAGMIDATVSQPADLYAEYALYYATAAAEGRTFRPGPTDHGSTIVRLANGLEDQLPSSLVTTDNVNDKGLWGNSIAK